MPADFMPGASLELEAKIEELIAQGYPAAAAAAMATSKQSKEQQIHLISGLQHGKKQAKPGGRGRGRIPQGA
jgi:hypothetical protein